MYLEATDTSLMTHQDPCTAASGNVPDTERLISRAGDGSRRVGHFQAANGGSMATEGMDAFTVRLVNMLEYGYSNPSPPATILQRQDKEEPTP